MSSEAFAPHPRHPAWELLGARGERASLSLLLAGFMAMALPTLWHLAGTAWSGDEQGHGPVILGVSLWLLWRRRTELLGLPYTPASVSGSAVLALAFVSYVIGSALEIVQLEVGALVIASVALLLLTRGWAGLRLALFPLFMLLFIVPLPGVFVQTITVPLKTAVSYVAEWLMHGFGYPVARTGVILAVGQYQLLVADACAGLTSMFTLECLGLVYVNLIGNHSTLHKTLLAILIVPIAFLANVVRVVILVLVTFHFGDAAGQGFVHGFAGIVLFVVATALMFVTDNLLSLLKLGRRTATEAA
jgi:exosortase B